MPLPKHIQRAADEVAQIEQAIEASQMEPDPPLAANIEPQPAEPPAVEPQAAAPAPAPVPAPPQPKLVDWEHKYKVLQGMFSAETQRLHEQLRSASTRLTELEKGAKKPAEPPAKPAADPKDVETFGADLVEMVGRVAERLFGPVVQHFEARVAQLEDALNSTGRTVTQTAEQTFWAEFERRVPNWESINTDERFIAFLAERDPVFGQPRQVALDMAQERLDPAAAAAVFKTWEVSVAPPPPAPAPSPKPSMNSQVAPTAGAPAPLPKAASAEIITSKQIEKFYNEVARGVYRGREAEMNAIEARINQALVEGRVR